MPRRLPRSLTLAAALTLGGGMAASFGLFIGVSHLEYDNMALAFGQRADQRVAAVRQGMGQAFEVLAVTNQLFSRGEPVSRERFADFTSALLERHRFIQAFNFHRVVPGNERTLIEAELQRVRPSTILTEMTPGGQVPAPLRNRYHVIEYVEPMAGNEAALGLNLSQNTAVMDALELARSTGQPAASSLFALAQAPTSQASFDLVQPVFDKQGVMRGNTAVVLRGKELVRE
ncbi:MAG: bifunctional diguanylate cyclase/phosphodiesterase, partial [Oxalobacteraceae bacterium]